VNDGNHRPTIRDIVAPVGLFSRRKDSEDASRSTAGAMSGSDGDIVRGTARVVSASSPRGQHGSAMYKSGVFHFVIEAPGIPAFAVEVHKIARTRRWPSPGMTLPVTISRSDPSRYEIDFSEIPNRDDVARDRAAAQAALMRGEAPPRGTIGVSGANVQFIGGSPADLPPDKLAKLESLLGSDLNGDGVVGAPTHAPPTAAPPTSTGFAPPSAPMPAADVDNERLVQLERLAALHRSGALTNAEFDREKQRLLGG
jgi:Short C-terminal domain